MNVDLLANTSASSAVTVLQSGYTSKTLVVGQVQYPAHP
jgi:hypothetical protein